MRVFLIAGEASGDRLGAALMAGLKTLLPEVRFGGVGGPLMQGQGLQSQFPMEELSIMGIAEVLPKYFHLKRRIRETAQSVLDQNPDVLITIDSPDFCLRVARIVREQRDIPTVHYVAPSVWAWRPGRADKMAKVIEHVLALLPFEPPYMARAGMSCDFVGHPVVSEPIATPDEITSFRQTHALSDAPLLLVAPGSRKGEIERLSPDFGAALSQFLADKPQMRVVVPTVAHLSDRIRELTQHWPGDPLILDPRNQDPETSLNEKRAAFGAAELALAASGTVSLELAASATPMVIGYKVQWLTWQLVKNRFLIDTANLVNLVSDTRTVPECIAENCTGPKLAAALNEVHKNPQAQYAAMQDTMQQLGLGQDAPGLRAARSVLNFLDQRRSQP